MWVVYFVHGIIFHITTYVAMTIDLFKAYADIAKEQNKFVDEIDPEYLFDELDRRMSNEQPAE